MLRNKLDQTDETGDSWNSLLPKSNILPDKQTNTFPILFLPGSHADGVCSSRGPWVWWPTFGTPLIHSSRLTFLFKQAFHNNRSSSVFCRHSYQVKSVFCRYWELGDQQRGMVVKYLWIFYVLCLIWTVCQYPPLASASYSTFFVCFLTILNSVNQIRRLCREAQKRCSSFPVTSW